jgi:signal transduction histidine kinase
VLDQRNRPPPQPPLYRSAVRASPDDTDAPPVRPRVWLVFLVLVPLLPFVVAGVAHWPIAHPDVVRLTGAWQATSTVTTGARSPTTATTILPGQLPTAGGPMVWTRHFDVPRWRDEPYTLVFGGLANGVASLRVNGVWVGDEGVPAAAYKLEHIGLHAYVVPARLLRVVDNEVAFTVAHEGMWRSPQRIDVMDGRLLLGPQAVVRPWFDRAVLFARLFEIGSFPLLAVMTWLVVGIARYEKDRESRRLQWRVAGLTTALLAYLGTTSGLVVVLGISRGWMPKVISLIALLIPDVVESAFLRRRTRLLRVNRVVCLAHVGVQFVISHPGVYLSFIPWMLLLIGWCGTVSLGALRRRPPPELVLLAGSVLALVVAALGDLLTDLHVVSLPRLFQLAAVDAAVIGAGFVVAGFVRTSRAHDVLLHRVEQKNRELTVALARAEESTRLKSAFLANTSHELRTPLNSIINVPKALVADFAPAPVVVCGACDGVFALPDEGWSAEGAEPCPACGAPGALRRDERPVFVGDAAHAARLLRSVEQSGQHLLAVVSDILDLSKLEAGQMTTHIAPVGLASLLGDVRGVLEPVAAARNITLVVSPGPDVVVATDATRLTQILVNLVGNAIKFSPVGSEVVVDVVVDEQHLVLAVLDHGIGIDVADHARIFDAFVQVDDGHTRQHGGNGLGLAITKHLVTLLGGDIRVTSARGAGAKFTVTLPRRRLDPVHPAEPV